jgi:hypothetical protein
MTRCGYCQGEIDASHFNIGDESRCPCGRRAVTRLPSGGTLVHAEGCPGPDGCRCGCAEVLGWPICTCPIGFGAVVDAKCPRHNPRPQHTITGARGAPAA